MNPGSKLFPMIVVLVLAFFFKACSTVTLRPEGRTASDQLLTAISIQDALGQLNLREEVQGKRISVSVTGHGTEIPYIEKAVPAYLMEQGAEIVSNGDDAEMFLTFVVDAAGSDELAGGISIPIVLPSLTTGLAITTINILKREEQVGMCRLWVYGTEPNAGYVFTNDPVFAKRSIKNFKIFGISLGRRSDIKELRQGIPVVDHLPFP